MVEVGVGGVPAPMHAVRLGPMQMGVPQVDAISHVRGVYGELWQMLGDGRELVCITVSTKQTPMGTADGLRDHLDWEAQHQASGSRWVDPRRVVPDLRSAEVVHVPGAVHAAKVSVRRVCQGIPVYSIFVGTSDGPWMHVVHLAMRDTDAGRRLGATISASVRYGGRVG